MMVQAFVLQKKIKKLTGTNIQMKASLLHRLYSPEQGEDLLIPYLENLLTDKTTAIFVYSPVHSIMAGEIRWLAAHALAAIRLAAGIQSPLSLSEMLPPLQMSDMNILEEKYVDTRHKLDDDILDRVRKVV
jgi:hypothetical protein